VSYSPNSRPYATTKGTFNQLAELPELPLAACPCLHGAAESRPPRQD